MTASNSAQSASPRQQTLASLSCHFPDAHLTPIQRACAEHMGSDSQESFNGRSSSCFPACCGARKLLLVCG